ncbi:MAG TPA: glycosyltransferase family 4 protein [Verrucomicrobiae bacterium]|nr:glycosyltransferase family 4 protein [Verrucomicrobiae bacterium]
MAFAALQSQYGGGEVWNLGSPARNGSRFHSENWKVRYAYGRKAIPAMWSVQTGLRLSKHTLIVAMHLHLAPVALPLVARGAELAVFLHGSEGWVPLSRVRTAALRRSSVLIANTSFTIRKFKAVNPAFTDREIVICPLGVPTLDCVSESPAHRKPFALIVSRISSTERHKGHDLLLQLWPQVIQRFPPARLMVVGDGDDRVRLQHKAAALGLGDTVEFLGRIDDRQLQQMYQDCALYVMPSSRLEGFGLAFLEAMRAGKACIGGDGAANEVIVHAETGFIIEEGDSTALLNALTGLFVDSDRRTKMGRAGKKRFLNYFTESHFRQRFLEALDQRTEK